MAAATWPVSVEPGVGRGIHGDRDPAQRGQVAERGQPRGPVRDPLVGVSGVGQPGRVGSHPQGGGQVSGVAVADQPVPAAAAVLGGQQLGGGQGSGQLQYARRGSSTTSAR